MVRTSLILAGAAASVVLAEFTVPSTEKAFWAETFQTTKNVFDGSSEWVQSSDKKYRGQKLSIQEGPKLMGKYAKDKALVMEHKAQHYGFGAKLPAPFALDGSAEKSSLVIQYEVKYREGANCAGTYLKLLRGRTDVARGYVRRLGDVYEFVTDPVYADRSSRRRTSLRPR